MKSRDGHFMPVALLESQITTLEEPESDEDYLEADIEKALYEVVATFASGIVRISHAQSHHYCIP